MRDHGRGIRRSDALVAAALVVATLAVYAPVRSHEFVNYDDPDYVTANPHVLRGLTSDGVVWALTTTRPHNWHPLTWLSHMLDVTFFGANAGPQLLENAALHAASAALLFLLLVRMTGATAPSAFVAALFAFHPLHVESVAWVTERKDVLSTLLWLLAANAYVSWVHERRRLAYALAVGSFGLAVMSKSMVVTFPFVLLLLDYWPLDRFPRVRLRELLVEKVPFFALASVGVVMTVVAQREQAMSALASVSLRDRLANVIVSYVSYLRKTIWPSDLAVFYPYPPQVPLADVLACLAFLLALTAAAVRLRRAAPYLLVGWLWFLGMLVPVSGIAQAGAQAMADRFTYLPLVGLFIAIAWGARDLLDRVRFARPVAAMAAALVLVACTVMTASQLAHWRTSETLFEHALAVTPGNFLAHNNLGEAFLAHGRVTEAKEHFAASASLEPRYPHAQNNLGSVLLTSGEIDEAMRHFNEALRLDPHDAETHRNLGLALYYRGDLDAAIGHFTAATTLQPDDARLQNNLAAALEKQGKIEQAIAHYAEAVRLDPGYARARANLAALRRRRPPSVDGAPGDR